MAKVHFRDYNPKQIILFPQRLDKDIAENDPVRIVDTIVDQLKLGNFRKLYRARGRSPYHPKMMLKAILYGYVTYILYGWQATNSRTSTPSTVSATG